jgi:cyclic pyranopterin phosphate synthase
MPLIDKHGRTITDLRVSITDRCNYRCVYCRSSEDDLPFSELLIEDYLRLVRIFVTLGIEKVRITGGEPLLRRELLRMVTDLAVMTTHSGKGLEVTITTNGHLLAKLAGPLKVAGLSRVTVSMDAVDPAKFARITRVSNGYEALQEYVRPSGSAWSR